MGLFSSTMPKGMSMPTGSGAFKALQNADVTTVVAMLKDALGGVVPTEVKPMILMSITSLSDKIETTFQTTLNVGYTNMYIAAAIIAGCGLIFTLLLRKKTAKI